MSNKTWYQIKAKSDKPKAADISIHDEIGLWGVSASAFMRDLRGMGELDEINLSIHSPGGDVLDGWAIYNSLKNSKAKITARVEGLAASMASVILMAADTVEIPENAYIMIHNPWGLAVGDAEEMRDTADLLDKLGNGLVNAYASRTGNAEDEIREMMSAETWMDGKEAVERGFADKLIGAVALSARAFDSRKFKMTPKSLQANSETAPEVAPVEKTANAPVEPIAPVDADAETEVEPQAPEVEVTEPQAKSLLSRFTALFGGETDETLKAALSAKDGEILAAKTEIDALKAQVAALEPKAKAFDEATAEIARLEAERQTAEAKAAAQVASLGFTPESERSLPDAETDKGDILAQYDAITDPAERGKFYNQNQKAIRAAQFKTKS
jgi:ATP-dependent Clp endopeptidase proteolytic subunit ClpP